MLASALFLAACGNSQGANDAVGGADETKKSSAARQNNPVNAEETAPEKNLVVYFSHSGNTQKIAELIHEKVGGDIFRIETANPYPQDYNACVEAARSEQENKARPALANRVENMDAYDTVFIGYPNWWGTMPMALFTFLEEYDLSGKRVIPFCTHEGSGLGRSVGDIAKLCPNSTILEGLAVRGSEAEAGNGAKTADKWLRALGAMK